MKKTMFTILASVAIFIFFLLVNNAIYAEEGDAAKEFAEFLTVYEAKVIPLYRDSNIASFDASISGKEEDYQKSADLQIKLKKIWANSEDFAKVKKWKESGAIKDPLLKRQLDIIYLAYLGNQIEEKKLEQLVNMQTEIEKKFNTFRATVDGKMLTDNEIEEILKSSTDSKQLEAVWKASKEIGKAVSADVLALIKLRNQVAKELGFSNYHAMQLLIAEQNPQEIEKLFDELDTLTRDIFVKTKENIDTFLAKRYNIEKSKLNPWHYQNRFFQEAPQIYDVDLDVYYKDKDVVEIARRYYDGIGLSMDEIFKKSDLYEKPGKYQHACCSDMDKEGDIRVICNVKSNYSWMSTLLHEFGHAAYAKFIDRKLPWTLRDCAHIFTTEAIAMMMEKFAANPIWLRDVIGIPEEECKKVAEASLNSQRLEMLVFSRWSQVMYRFEKSLYENPDQDLNKLWWDLVEKYQLVRKPEGRNEADWASKIHIATVPAYYHNYLMGDILGSQLMNHINSKMLQSAPNTQQSWKGEKLAGAYLIEFVFKPGMRYPWNEMIERATGEKLTAAYYAKSLTK